MAAIIILVIVGSLYAFDNETDTIQGQADVTEYRVSSKVPGRVLKYMVKEGDYVHAGDTLAILEAPDVAAKLTQAQAAEDAAAAQSRKAEKGARQEQIAGRCAFGALPLLRRHRPAAVAHRHGAALLPQFLHGGHYLSRAVALRAGGADG